MRALLFADIRGFSKLSDEQYPCFDENVTAAFVAGVVDQAEGVATVNTWGDALHVVLDDAVAAANCALGLQDAMSSVDLRAAGLPEHLALRLGAHLGPVLPSFDPVRRVPIFTGSHVSRTARIEPVTPPGAIYVPRFRRRPALGRPRRAGLRLRGPHARGQGLGPAEDVQVEAPERPTRAMTRG